jgi:hypothetical protein
MRKKPTKSLTGDFILFHSGAQGIEYLQCDITLMSMDAAYLICFRCQKVSGYLRENKDSQANHRTAQHSQ